MEGGRDPTTVYNMNFKKETKEKKWIIKSTDTVESEREVNSIASELGIHPIMAKLLYNRGYSDAESAKSFIYMESEMLSDPFKMKDIDKGIERIRLAIENGERITVYGDYDVDGVTAVCTLYMYLKAQNANVDYYIPSRIGEGYGVSSAAIDAIKQNGTTLIITVDTGITAVDEVDYAKKLGIDFVITDHHECRAALPQACAVINPHRPDCTYPFKELAGVGVVFKFVCAYEEKVNGLSRSDATRKIFGEYADLVAIGTIADVMPIREENRIIVRYGLSKIENNKRVGLAALMDVSSGRSDEQRQRTKKRSKITSGYIGYTIAPRINAAGRIKNATMAVELFLSDDREFARQIAEELCQTNRERQAEENKIMQEAHSQIENYDIDKNPIIVLNANNWHHGVIGIVSSRITEKYSRPSILVSFEGNASDTPSEEDIGKGSGRSIKGINLVDALCYCSEHLVKFGGHELAAGLSVKRSELPKFCELINEYARNNLTDKDLTPTIEADCKISFDDISLSLAKEFQMLEPYGVSNPVPVFVLSDVTVNEISGVSDGKHTKFVLGNGKHNISAMYFSNSPSALGIFVGDRVDVLFNIDINEWAGRESVQLIVRDIVHSSSQEKAFSEERRRFEEIKQGATFSQAEDVMPSREDFAVIFNLMRSSLRMGIDTMSHREITSKFTGAFGERRIGYIKLKIIVMVLKELNLVSLEEISDEVYKFAIHYTTSKTDLEKSTWLRRFRSQIARNS